MTELATRREYSDEDRRQAAIQYAINGNLAKVARSTSIPRTTLIQWSKLSLWDDVIVEVRHEKSQEHIAQYNIMVDMAQTKAIELIPSITSAREATLVACMSQDKGLLLQGKPTSITKSSTGLDAMVKKFEAIADSYNERQTRVISNQ